MRFILCCHSKLKANRQFANKFTVALQTYGHTIYYKMASLLPHYLLQNRTCFTFWHMPYFLAHYLLQHGKLPIIYFIVTAHLCGRYLLQHGKFIAT